MQVEAWIAPNWWAPHECSRRAIDLDEGATVSDAVRAITQEGAAVLVDGVAADGSRALREGERVQIVLIPGTAEPISSAAVLKFLGTVLFSIGISYVIGKLTAPNLPAKKPEDDASPTYGWSGIRTVYQPVGLPYPEVLGEHWVGGYVIQRFLENEQGPDRKSWLYLLVAVSLGPVRSVAGVLASGDRLTAQDLDGLLINGNLARNYTGIEAWVRLGSLQQEVVEPFGTVRAIQEVALPLSQVTEESGDPLEDQWQRAVQVETPGECERSMLTVRFPRGLYDLTTGEIEEERVDLQVRYARSDSEGNRITDWATAYDGDDSTFQIRAAFQGSFAVDLEVPFFDPETVTPPVPGLANHLDGSNDAALTGSRLTGNPSWSAGARFDGTVLFRGLIYAHRTTNPIASWADWNGLLGNGSMVLTGWMLGCRGDLGIGRSWFTVYWGDGTGNVQGSDWDYYEGKANPTLDDLLSRDVPYQLTFTFEHDAFPQSATPHRLRLWIDDALFGEKKTAVPCTCPTVGKLYAGTWVGKEGDSAYCADLDFDELEVWAKVYGADDVAFRHASGSWTVPGYPDPDLVAYYPFGADNFSSVPDFSGNGNDLGWVSSPYPAAIPGWTYVPASGTVVLSRYLVQVQRIDAVRDGLQVADECELESLTAITSDAYGYPGIALLGLKILASEQLNGSEPGLKILVRGRADLPRWDGRSEENPTFARVYSRNPSDQLGLVATDPLEGAGNFYAPRLVDWQALDGWRKFCDRQVYDQRGTFHAKSLAKVSASSVGLSDAEYPDGLYALTFRLRVRNYTQTISFRVDSSESTEYPTGDFQAVNALQLGDGSFVIHAAWPSGFPAPTTNPFNSSTAALTWRLRPQIQTDLVLGERNLRFWGLVQILCAAGRAVPIRIGDKLSVVWQDKRQPVALFNASNIDPASFRATARRRQDQPNVLTAEFADVDQRNERSVATRVHPELTSESSSALRVAETVEMRGATERHQVRRELDYLLARARAENLELELRLLLDAIFLQVGDVALITYPVPRWAYGGTIPARSIVATSFVIDVGIVLDAGTTYFAAVSNRESGQVAYVQVASGSGTYAAGSAILLLAPLPFVPALGDLWTVGTDAQSTRPYQLFGRAWDPQSHYVKTKWVAYSDDVYPADDHGVDDDEEDVWEGAPETGGPSTGGDPVAESGYEMVAEPAEVRVEEHATRDRKGGAQRVDLRVYWTALGPASRMARVLIWAENESGSRVLLGEVPGYRQFAEVPGDRLRRGERYRISVQAVSPQGSRRGLSSSPAGYITLRALYAPPPVPEGLEIVQAGESIRIDVALPEGAAGCAVEIRRGAAFVGRSLGLIPPGGRSLIVPVDWASPPGGERIEARLVSPSGVRSDALAVTWAGVPPGSTVEGSLDYSGDGWTAPGGTIHGATFSELEVDSEGRLHFEEASIVLEGTFDGWELDLGAVQRVQIAHALDGSQVSAATAAQVGGMTAGSPAWVGWTGEGSLDPAHPAYEAGSVQVEWAHSDVADPGSSWEPFAPGFYSVRSVRFRVRCVRATASSDIRVATFTAIARSFAP